jgi:hypothetical protein
MSWELPKILGCILPTYDNMTDRVRLYLSDRGRVWAQDPKTPSLPENTDHRVDTP